MSCVSLVGSCSSVTFGVGVVCGVVVGVVIVVVPVGVGVISVAVFVGPLLKHVVHLLDLCRHPPGADTIVVDME